MCRSIRTLANFAPPATDDELRASALQFVRKLSGVTRPSRANEEVFDRAVDEVAGAARRLIDSLRTTAPPRNREDEARKARRKRGSDMAPEPAAGRPHGAHRETVYLSNHARTASQSIDSRSARLVEHPPREVSASDSRVRHRAKPEIMITCGTERGSFGLK